MQHSVTPADAPLAMGRLRVAECADSPDNPAQTLRALCFRNGSSDRDALDPACRHFVVTDRDGATVAAFRLMILPQMEMVARSYSARFYDLSRLAAQAGAALELGRFCIRPGGRDPDILRLSWALVTRLVDRHGITLLFGCSSFSGTDPAPYLDAFAALARNHLAPAALAPQRAGATAVDYPALVQTHAVDPRRALASMPPLLRSYLTLGGWVSDHAIIDRDLDTLHVFTGVEIARIPPARARLLRGLADSVIDLPARPD